MHKFTLVLTERELDMLDKYLIVEDADDEDVQRLADILEKVYATQQPRSITG